MAEERLQKILSAAGAASRRDAEKLIVEGHVAVNGVVVTALGSKADPLTDSVTLDGRRVVVPDQKIYAVLYKPRGYVSTLSDPQGRPTIRELLPRGWPRVFHVGRLDFQTEGLLVVTNDGEFAERVSHPRFGCPKVYLAKVSGTPNLGVIQALRRGIPLDGARTAPARVEIVHSTRRDGNTWMMLTLTEGRSREVRRMLLAVGHPVSKLKRVRIGPIEDRNLEPGTCRPLTPREVTVLREGKHEREPGARAPERLAKRHQKKIGLRRRTGGGRPGPTRPAPQPRAKRK